MNRSGMAVMIDGCRLAWQLERPEDAPVLMLSNSLGTAMGMWQLQLAAFTRRGFAFCVTIRAAMAAPTCQRVPTDWIGLGAMRWNCLTR